MKTKKINCLECNSLFTPKRTDSKFCSPSCKNSYNYQQRRDKSLEEEKGKRDEVTYLKGKDDLFERDKALAEAIVAPIIAIVNGEIATLRIEEKRLKEKLNIEVKQALEISALETEEKQLNNKINYTAFWIEASDEMIYNCFVGIHREVLSKERQPSIHQLFIRTTSENIRQNTGIWNSVKHERTKMRIEHAKHAAQLVELINKIQITKSSRDTSKFFITPNDIRLKQVTKQISTLQKQIPHLMDLEKAVGIKQSIKQQNKVTIQKDISTPKNIDKLAKGEMSASSILNAQYKTIKLNGELGDFLGKIELQSCAITLIGDSGAGKSYFSYDLAELFDQNGFKVYYFSLEEGIGELTRNKLKDKTFSNNFKIIDNGKLPEVRKAAKHYNVIIIDSFGKIDAKPTDFDKLRMDFPETIFICIFQKTAQGSVRGGSAIVFDSSAIIDVQLQDEDRVAVMTKSRYGTANWEYSIVEKRITKRLE